MEQNPKRRKIIKIIIKGILFLCGIIFFKRYLFPLEKKHSSKLIEIKNITPIKDGAVVFPEKKIAIVNKNGKFFALSLICPHLGCTVKVVNQYIICPCHGSKFLHTGKYISGPAKKDLIAYNVFFKDDNTIIIDLNKPIKSI